MKKDQYIDLLNSFVLSNKETLSKSAIMTQKKGQLTLDDFGSPLNSKSIYNTNLIDDLFVAFSDMFLDFDYTISLRGHFPKYHKKSLQDLLKGSQGRFIKSTLERYLWVDVLNTYVALENKTEREYLLNFDKPDLLTLCSTVTCPHCDTYLGIHIDYNTLSVITDDYLEKECSFNHEKDYDEMIVVKLTTPSNKLVVFNTPKVLLDLERANRYETSINSIQGITEETLMYSGRNIGYFFISDRTPKIYQKPNEIIISDVCPDNNNPESEAYDPRSQEMINQYDYKGFVSTSAWWVTVMDYDHFHQLCTNKRIKKSDIEHLVLNIGSDLCEIIYDLKNFDSSEKLSTLISIKF